MVGSRGGSSRGSLGTMTNKSSSHIKDKSTIPSLSLSTKEKICNMELLDAWYRILRRPS